MKALVFIHCAVKDLDTLLEDVKNWEAEGAFLLWSATTDKARQGYLFIGWERPVPESFQNKLQDDPAILDCFTIEGDFPSPDEETDIGPQL
jgi:hypothetical protein